jgi:CRP-like cAMP-binding protein
MKAADFLARVSLFAHLKKRDLRRLAARSGDRRYRTGEVIIEEGVRGDRLFVIVSGEVAVIKGLGTSNPQTLHRLGSAAYFGEMALLDDLIRTASVVALRDTQVLYLDRWDLRSEIDKYPGLAVELLQMLTRRLRSVEKRMVSAAGTDLPVCSCCGRVHGGDGVWVTPEAYAADHPKREADRQVCPYCAPDSRPEPGEQAG